MIFNIMVRAVVFINDGGNVVEDDVNSGGGKVEGWFCFQKNK